MIVAFPADVQLRLDAIEEAEGIPATELVHQAVSVWSQLNETERRQVGFFALGLVMQRLRNAGQE